ncbi:hypothetical protein HOP62_02690 [Halomonas sp. MCCC 1A17488]|uniref:lipopolysaccharide kinase InaA family protein n=1 Tax=unclassified Halomonas TaxID=2609666 RepID=UPI0018D23657|nr:MULTISPECIES: lipopolysaccharide kinase InaA family protein [unclassified Halomonas]MCE8014981.1 hypothetical protein [Halomonas sp. MCCC 1A17488]MCG3238314.1 hypothetical protein [Halomonas sp. MCCC 1A17488]QPP47935.1 hypothetical protein I4484_11710 [Halomonas sp. SS10-MC5]
MKLLDIPFNDRHRRYLIFQARDLPDRLVLASTSTTAQFESIGSSRFFTSSDGNLVAKVVPDKYSRWQSPLKWLMRDYLEKRWLGQCDAREEYESLQILKQAGLTTPRCHGWGISLNPGNSNASLLLTELIHDARPGGEVFDEIDEADRLAFLERFCTEVAQLAKLGYVHRDLHYNNLLIRHDQTIVWIDANVRKIRDKRNDTWSAVRAGLSESKLRGADHLETVKRILQAKLGQSTGNS